MTGFSLVKRVSSQSKDSAFKTQLTVKDLRKDCLLKKLVASVTWELRSGLPATSQTALHWTAAKPFYANAG